MASGKNYGPNSTVRHNVKVIMTLTPSVTVGLRCENQFDFEKTERLANFMSAVRNV